jgi:glycosyltransferase involved in cell wall biosynthesis
VHRRYLRDDVVKFFPAGDYEALAKAIEELHHAPRLRERYVERGLAFMNSNHWGVKKRVYLNLVDSLTGAAPRHEMARSVEALERRVGE